MDAAAGLALNVHAGPFGRVCVGVVRVLVHGVAGAPSTLRHDTSRGSRRSLTIQSPEFRSDVKMFPLWIWAPQVIEDAVDHGLVLGENGRLYDTKKGEALPEHIKPMPLLTEKQLEGFQEFSASEVIPRFIARYHDLISMADDGPVRVIGENGVLKDKPGFEVDLINRTSLDPEPYIKPNIRLDNFSFNQI